MKKTRVFVIPFCIVVALLIFWRNHLPAPKAIQETDAILESQTNPSPESVKPNSMRSSPTSNAVSTSPNRDKTIQTSNRADQMDAESQKALDQWRTPIEFFGCVIDENTNPVTGAQVDFGCNDLSPTGTSNYHTTSDQNGFFSISGIKGMLLNVNVSKAGYYTSRRDSNYFYYAGDNVNYVPDARNPVVFHLRKKMPGESLIVTDYPGFAHIAQLRHDGTPVSLDLLKGVQVPEGVGQFQLEFWRDLSDKNARIFDWRLQLSFPNGGIVPTDQEFDFQAPEEGYEQSIVVDMPATNQNWQAEIRNKYYVKLADGEYGRIDFYLLPRNGVFSVQSAVNPSGSRDLEPPQ